MADILNKGYNTGYGSIDEQSLSNLLDSLVAEVKLLKREVEVIKEEDKLRDRLLTAIFAKLGVSNG